VYGAAFVSAAPYTYYVSTIAFPDKVRTATIGKSAQEILAFDMSAMAIIVVIASLVGSLTSERYRLGGIGDLERTKRAWPFIVVAIFFSFFSYFVFGARLAAAVPAYYPKEVGWAAAMMIKGAVFDEVVARYGMMTIVCGVARRPIIANVLQAVFFTVVGLRSMAFFGVHVSVDLFVISGLVASFAVHLVLGHVYARYGLLAACTVHLGLEIERMIHIAIT
jgi:hypothetical protein